MSRIQHRAKFLFCTCTCRSSRCLARLLKIDDRILGVTFEKKPNTFLQIFWDKIVRRIKKKGERTREHTIQFISVFWYVLLYDHAAYVINFRLRPFLIINFLSRLNLIISRVYWHITILVKLEVDHCYFQ